MKHNYVLLLAFATPVAGLFAQPALDAPGTTPVAGDQITVHAGNFVQPGAAGANQIWDHSAIAFGAANAPLFVTPASTGLAGTFPNATVAVDLTGGNYQFYRCTATSFEEDGFSASGYIGTSSDRLTLLVYPFTYNSTFTDAASWDVIPPGGNPYTRTANIGVTADGYGTLVTPWGTVTNVLRVHSGRYIVDNEYTPATTFTWDSWSFYKPGVHHSIMDLERTSFNFFGFISNDSTSHTIDQNAVGVEEAMRHDIGVDLQPNPANDRVEVVYGVEAGRSLSIDLLDVTSKAVRTLVRRTQATGVQREFMDLAGLTAGIYLVRITDDRGATGMRRLVVR